MAQPNRALKLLDQLPDDLSLAELREIESRVKALQARILKLEAEKRKSA